MDVINVVTAAAAIFASCFFVGWLMARLGWVKVIGITKGPCPATSAIGPSRAVAGGAYNVLKQITKARVIITTNQSSTWIAPVALRHSKAQLANSAGTLAHSTLPRPLLAA